MRWSGCTCIGTLYIAVGEEDQALLEVSECLAFHQWTNDSLLPAGTKLNTTPLPRGPELRMPRASTAPHRIVSREQWTQRASRCARCPWNYNEGTG